MPVLNPYVLTSIQDETYTYERNPYYFKIDKDGKQLPYIDKLISPKVQDGEMENMKAIVGEADILRRNAALAKLPLYKDNEAKGNYSTLILDYHLRAPVTLNLNLTYKDPSFRQVVNDVRFRQALSIGMNHQEIIDSVYLQQGKTPSLIPAADDLAKANKYLDDMGMKVGTNGLRNAVDGKPFALLIEVGASAADQVPTAELLSSQYRKNLKLDVSFKKLDTALFNQKNTANEVQATIFWSFDAMADDEATIRWVQFMPLWNLWRNDPKTGEEPPAWVKQGIDLDNKRMTLVYGTPEYFAQKEIEAKYFYDNVPAIPIVESSKIPLILSKKFANGPVAGYQIAGLMLVEGMYLK
jgi:peptide/nickel transport system substrate-binding protein